MSPAFTPAQIDQLRRDAKRLGREHGLSHAQALDRIAGQHGFGNWSLLARTAPPAAAPAALRPSPASPARSAASLMHELGLPRMDASRAEVKLIAAIVDRFETLRAHDVEVDRLSLMMDLEACHCNGCPLDLISLHEVATDFDFLHDVGGIRRHLNRETGQLQDHFRPRYARPSAS